MFERSAEKTQEFDKRGTMKIFHEIQPLDRIPPKFLWNKPFHKNLIGFAGTQFFISKESLCRDALTHPSRYEP